MQTISNVTSVTTLPARPAAAVKGKAESRLAYIDVIRMILTILVIMMHAGITYGAFGDWTFTDPTLVKDEITAVGLSLFNFTCQAFFMGLFFFFAGYFTPGSFDRKGIGRFWKDRLLRIAVPMLLYTYLLSRVPQYLNAVAHGGWSGSIWNFTAQTWWTQADAGPTWFLFALLVFSLGYTLWRTAARILKVDLAWASRLPAPTTKALLLTGLVFGALMFAVAQVWPIANSYHALNAYNLMLAFFPFYIILFAGGTLAYRNNWLSGLNEQMLRFWALFSAVLIVLLPVMMVAGGAIKNGLDAYVRGMTWQCFGLCLWFGFTCIALCTTLTLWMRRQIKPQSRLAAAAGPNTFAVYLIHPLVLVPITYALMYATLTPFSKYLLASAMTVIIGYAVASMLRRVPGAKTIL